MTKQRLLLWVVMTVLLAGLVLPAYAAPAPKEPAPKVGQKAGAISALLPVATVTRGTGKAAVTNQAKKGDELVWNDLVKTEKGGRARITLTDQSILSLGSQSQLKIVKHDDKSQQTALQLYGGRMRAEVAKITRDGGSFELRTPTAVAGVIGTDFGSDASSVGTTVFLCISGITQVSSSDLGIPGSVQCAAGMTTSVTAGKPPTYPANATQDQINKIMEDTEPAIISAMSPTAGMPPASGMPPTMVDATINGSNMATVKTVNVTGSGVTAQLGTVTDTSVTVHMMIAANATPGPHTLTLTKPKGLDSAAIFTVLVPATPAGTGDLKKPYHDLFDQERQIDKAGLTALVASVQQAVDQALQALQTANQGNVMDLSTATSSLNYQVAKIQTAVNQAGVAVDQAVTTALATFDSQYQVAFNALLQRNSQGTPDDTFNQALQAAFNQANASLGVAFANISSGLNTNVQAATSTVTGLGQSALTAITAAANVPPTPGVNNTDFSAFLGAAFGGGTIAAPDASRSKGNNGASISGYHWVLCDSSYKPAQFGVPIAANATGCNALPGYASSNSDFQFPTCNLTAADYIARVTVTDSKSQQAAMDVKIHVLASTYDDPSTRVLNLALAYGNLQPTAFLAFFDQTAFSGYNSLEQNVRSTFPVLASMNINPRVSQANISCNDVTVRADWVQNYTYKANPTIPFSQSEQLSIRMSRAPGKGWYISDFQGDNGTVQGQLPGPAVTDNPQPDLQVTSVYATYTGASSTQSQVVPPGAQSFTAAVTNVGGADLTVAANVLFSLLDINNATLTTSTVSLAVPLKAGATQNVTATLTVPNTLAIGAPFQVQATVNPSCTVAEANCDALNTSSQTLTLGTPVHVTQTATPNLFAGGAVGVLTVTVDGPGTFALVLPTGIIGCAPLPCVPSAENASPIAQTVTSATGGALSWNLQALFTSVPGTALTTNITFLGFNFPVNYSVTGQANYVIQSISFVGHTPPYTGAQGIQVGENLIINAVMANVGNVSPVGQITVTASCSGGPGGNTACSGGGGGVGNPTTTIAAPVAGTAVTLTMTATTNNFVPGTYLGQVALTTTLAQSSTADDSLTLPFEAVDFNLSIVVPAGFLETQPGGGATQIRALAGAPSTPTQNVLLGGTAQISVHLDETGNPTAFVLPVTATTDNAAVTFPTPTVNVNPNSTVVTTLTTSPAGAVPVTAVYSATNHGVTKNAVQVLNYVTASVTPTNLFLNGPSDPLKLQMGQTSSACVIVQGTPPAGCPANPDITLTASSTPSFAGAAGNAATVTPPAPVSGFTATVTPGTVTQGGRFDLRVAAAVGATPQVTALPVVVTLPNSNPPANVTYTLYVQAIGVPDLQVVSVTPARTLSTATPWLSGEGLDFTVVVRNGGNTASAGNEILTMNLNGYQVDPGGRGLAVKVPALGSNTSTNIVVHAIAPDVGVGTLSSGALVTKVAADTAGDLNYADNSLTQNVAVSNWHLAVGNPGLSDAAPLVVTITSGGSSWSNQALLTGTIDNGGTTALTFIPTPGVVGSKLAITNFAPGTGPNSFLVTVLTSDNTTQSGLYPAQVIVSLMDGGAVTAQRQATIHVQVSNTFTNPPSYSLGLTCTHNGASCVAGAGPATTIQVNGALTEQYIATVVPSCTPTEGVTCQGTADIVITDGTNTTTTPPQAKGQPFNTGALFQLAANLDANGNITTGAAGGYSITVNGIQRSRAISPDPVGQSVSVPVNVGDIIITTNAGANGCTAVAPNGPPVQLTVSWATGSMGGFNVPTIAWEWEDANHVPVGAAPLSFTSPSGTSSGAPNYTNPPAFNLTNTPALNVPPPDGLLLYFFAATVSNGTSTATKYFPFYFDASLSQNFCGAAGAARGGFTRINGSWSRSAVGGGAISLGRRPATGAASGSVDLHVSAADVSYTPSIPKFGDTVQVRFRVRNDGAADAKGVPIALQVNGVTVASDTFDVGAGHTALGGLQWNSASVPVSVGTQPAALRPARIGARTGSGLTRVSALLVIDPQHTVQQKTALDKSAPLAHFTMSSGDGGASGVAAGPSQRVLLEIQEGACAGMRLSTGGVGPCGTADLELTIVDIARGIYMLNADFGVADLGAGFGGVVQGSARASSELAGIAGHSYSVQLSGGRTAVITIDSIRNPRQLDAATRAVFRNSAIQVMRGLGSDSGAASTGDVAGGIRGGATVFVQLSVQVR
jgi:hypothetical protein